ncbi:hypothetical protein GCM10027217_04850 [Pseudomaricurvus hydrocarbonicus]
MPRNDEFFPGDCFVSRNDEFFPGYYFVPRNDELFCVLNNVFSIYGLDSISKSRLGHARHSAPTPPTRAKRPA